MRHRPYGALATKRWLSLLLTPSGAETLVFWVSQPLPWPVAPKDVPLMTRRGDLKLSHGATAKARENAVQLRSEYEHQTSDDAIDEIVAANE